ncbi:hypothetical protein VTI74DRAFT_1947 [Chaetomium olivicolor]
MRVSAPISAFVVMAWGSQATAVTNKPIRNVYTFPKNTFIESIAARANSELLITSMSVPELFSIDPTAPNPDASIIHTFTNASGISGIAEMSPDVFALVTGVFDLASTRALPGTLAVWTIDFTTCANPLVRFITQIENSTILNGVSRHPTNPRLLLAADSALGAVWRVNITTRTHDIAFSSPLLTPTGTVPGSHLGINGIRASEHHVYFTNSAQRFFGR